jgi:hypothetical protein
LYFSAGSSGSFLVGAPPLRLPLAILAATQLAGGSGTTSVVATGIEFRSEVEALSLKLDMSLRDAVSSATSSTAHDFPSRSSTTAVS